MKILDIDDHGDLKYVTLDEEADRIEERQRSYGLKEKFFRLISGKGWSFLPKRRILKIQDSMANYTKSVRVFSPRHGKVKIVFRQPGELVYVIDEPRLPLFSIMMHHHGKHRATVDADYKCTRCGKEVPAIVKSLALAETMTTF